MAKLILQNQRGSTSAWKNSLIIPAEGELVIEECEICEKTADCIAAYEARHADGYDPSYILCDVCGKHLDFTAEQIQCKVGDGIHTFPDLPYVTDVINDKVKLLTERVNNIIAPEDSTVTLDAEVEDIRIGYDGVSYPCAGDAVRAVGDEVSDLRNSLSQFINADAVDGLYYENNMLYLSANGKVLEDTGVEIVSGGGGGGSADVKVKLTNLTPQGTNFSIITSDIVDLKFQFTSLEDDVPTGEFTAVIQVNGVTKQTLYLEQNDTGHEVDITGFLSTGENKLRLTCTDIYGNSRTLVYNINVIDLSVRSAFNANIVYKNTDYPDGIDFRYTVVGLIEKTVYFYIDDKKIAERTLSASTSGKEISQVFPMSLFTHGTHILKVYAQSEVNSTVITSNILQYDLLIQIEGETAPMISSSIDFSEVSEGELISIPYIVFDPNDAICKVSLTIYNENGTIYSTTDNIVDQTLQTWSTRNYPVGNNIKFSIIYAPDDLETPIIKSHIIKVTESDFNIEPEADPSLYLSAIGRNNTHANRDSWTFNDITTTFENFNWSSNGWVQDDDGDTCLRLAGGAQATINFAPFSESFFNIQNTGLTIELEFAIRDVNDRETVVIDCFGNNCGIQATADRAFIRSTADMISCNYKDEEKLKLAFTIAKDGKDANGYDSTRFLCIYLNGVLSRVVRYESNDFIHNNYIRLGDIGCTLDVYTIRIYNRELTMKEITNNYIADISNITDKIEIYEDNDIYNALGQLSYEELKTRIPTITFTGSMPTYKGDKKIVWMDFENPFDESKNFSNVYGGPIQVEIDVQGTSSQWYARKNWKLKWSKKKDGVVLFDHPAYQHMDNQVPAKVFCIKVDYAEATGTHNTQNANFIETLYDEIIPPQVDDRRVRTTIAGFPCVIFEKETETSDPIFSSKGNFNFDKGAENAFGFTSDYDTECWEFCNNTSNACNFLGEVPRDWVDDFEPRYTPHGDEWDLVEELQELKDNATDSQTGQIDRDKFSLEQEEQLLSLRDTLIAKFKAVHDWVVSTKDDLNKFKNEFEDYFDLHYSLIYYVYTFFALMTDQRAKNMFLTRWTTYDETRGEITKWYPYFYDNDTCFGINNEGYLIFDYYHEDTDQVDNTNVYNGQNSILWNNFRKAFSVEIKEAYATLRNNGKLTYEKLTDQVIEQGSEKWSASVYNEDSEYKYLTMARPENAAEQTDGKINTENLYQVKGDGESHLMYFLENRFKYCDSKWYTGDYPDDYIVMRINTPQVSVYPSDTEISNLTLNADQSYDLCIVGTQYTDVTLNYTYGELSGSDIISIGDSGYVIYHFTAPVSSTYTFTIAEDYKIVEVGGSYPEGVTEEEKAEIDAANAQLQASLDAVPASPVITLTPYSAMYCGVRYKANGTLLQTRVTNLNTPVKFGENITEVFNDTETAIYGASELSSLDSLAGLYLSVLNTSEARKLTNLIVGDHNPNYRNTMLREINVGANKLLKVIDITNCIRLNQALGMTYCDNIEEIYAMGTSITSVALPAAGYLNTLHIPNTINELIITNHPNLKTENLKIGETGLETQNITRLCLVNCPNLDVSRVFESCLTENTNLLRVRLTDINWTDWTVSDLQKLYKPKSEGGYGLKGLDANNNNTDIINISGVCTLSENVTGEVMAELVKHLPYLEFKMAGEYKVTSIVTFMNNEGTEPLYVYTLSTSQTQNVTCPDPVAEKLIAVPTRVSTPAYDYEWSGWSIQSAQDRVPQEDALKNILGDKVLYPAFTPILRSYNGAFYTGEYLLYDELIKYNYPISFDSSKVINQDYLIDDGLGKLVPRNMASATPEAYEFSGWIPVDNIIVKDTNFFAQFYINDNAYYTPTINDLTYVLDTNNKLMTITGYTNPAEPIIKISSNYTVDDVEYSTYKLFGYMTGDTTQLGFRNSGIEYCEIPDSLSIIGDNAFNNCDTLTSLHIGSGVTEFNDYAVSNCVNLNNIYYDAENATVIRHDTSDGMNYPFTNSGPETGMNIKIGPHVTKIPQYLFYQATLNETETPINTLDLSEANNCTVIDTAAFNHCNIQNLIFGTGLTQIKSTAFAYNFTIKELSLPEGIESLGISAFGSWKALTSVHLPSTLRSLDGAFRYCPYLENFDIAEGSILGFENGALLDKTVNKIIFGTKDTIITSNIKSIASYAFSECEGLTAIHIPSNITQLPTETFSGCANLTQVTFDEGLTYLGSQCFYQCEGLTELTLPSTLREVSSNTFGESSLVKIVFPESTQEFGINIFLNCRTLEEVTFLNPEVNITVTVDGVRKLFNGCVNLKTINVAWSEGAVPGWEDAWGAPYPENVTINYNYGG